MVLLCMGKLQDAWAKKMDMAEQTASVRTIQIQRARRSARALVWFLSLRDGGPNRGLRIGCILVSLVALFMPAVFLNSRRVHR